MAIRRRISSAVMEFTARSSDAGVWAATRQGQSKNQNVAKRGMEWWGRGRET
jgi:hypothetical protein